MRLLLFAWLIFALPAAIAADFKSMPNVQTEIIRAEFGIFQNGDFIPTNQVPLVIGQTYGWRIKLITNKTTVKWREQFILPSAPKDWGVNKIQGKNEISTDRRVSITELEVNPINGVISNAWSVVKGDPEGHYMIRVTVDNQPEQVFVFDVKTPTKHSN